MQRAMACLYLALGIFVVVGAIEVLALTAAWLLTGLALAGSGMLFYASILLTQESAGGAARRGGGNGHLMQHDLLA